MLNNVASKKAFTYEYVGQFSKTRVPFVGSEEKYNPERHFMWFEESDYLSTVLGGVPYATFKTDDRETMEDLLQNGFTSKDGVVWAPFFAYWKDQEGHAFMCPKSAGIKDLRDVGVLTSMKSPADFMKVGKYTNRLFAALPKKEYGGQDPIWGKEVEWNEEDGFSLIQLDQRDDFSEEDLLLSVRYIDLKTMGEEERALVDGCIAISEKAVRAFGLSKDPRIGMAWRGTFGTERGLGKGHILYVPHLQHDVVIYGPKTILKTSRFFFGSMGDLHVGVPHTDRQSYINFQYHRPGLGVELAKAFMLEVVQASKDEAAMRRLFLRYTKDLKHSDLDQEAWVLRRALAYGISFLRFPGLFRRVVHYMMKRVLQCDERIRIPMDKIANYGYVLPDPNAIDSEGDVDLSKAIPAGSIVFPDVDGNTEVVCYRQPSENSNAWVKLKTVYRPEFKLFAGRGICLLGNGAKEVLNRLGGGDMDDQFVIVHDPKWVDAFNTLRPYPETERLSAEVVEEDLFDVDSSDLERFTDELLFDLRDRNVSHYTNKHVSWQIEMAKNARAGIGPVVNFGMIDMLMSDPDHRASMLNDLRNQPEFSDWFMDREPWQAARFMTNLEVVIDGNVKDNTLLRRLGNVSGTIRAFHKGCKVYPASMVKRIPVNKVDEGGYVLARSLTCKSLEQIRALRERLQEVFIEREWALVAPADKELRTSGYKFDASSSIRVRGQWRRVDDQWQRVDENRMSLMDMWAEAWRKEMSSDHPHDDAYARICKYIAGELYGEDDDSMEKLAVELYYQLYRTFQTSPKVDEASGKLRTYPDGLLWSPIFGNHFINALRKSRLSGFYKAAEIRPEYLRKLRDKSTTVEIRNHSIYIQESDDKFTIWVGFVVGKSPDGLYRMDSGLIEIRRAKPICQPSEDYLMVAQKPLVRVVPSSPVKEELPETKKEVVAKGVFGKILSKALSILK